MSQATGKADKTLLLAVGAVGLGLVLVYLPVLIMAVMLVTIVPSTVGPTGPACVGSGNYAAVSGALRVPLSGPYTVTSVYGMRFHPIFQEWRLHNGVDLVLTDGPGPILAAMDGTVTSASMSGAAGNQVILDHGGGLETIYMHLSSFAVTAGQKVRAGDQLGIEGTTGASTGNHLHWSVRINGAYTDPVAWAEQHGLKLDGTPTATGSTGAGPSGTPSMSSVAGYSGAQLTNATQIIKAGKDIGADTWTITVAVMTAMGESSLVNLTTGDAVGPDSRGLFQQRDNGAWGTLADRMDPYTAATNFYKALLAVPNYRTLEPTIAAHKTQRNADPYHYERYWDPATQVVAALLNDPLIMAALANQGTGCATAVTGPVAGMPTSCPASGMSGEYNLQPTALNALRCVHAVFPQITVIGGWRPFDAYPDHPSGLALDIMIPNYHTPEGRALGDQVAAWLQTHSSETKVYYLIWQQRSWYPDRGWKPMADRGSPTQNHMDHVHVSFYAPDGSKP